MNRTLAMLLAFAWPVLPASIPADSARGHRLFESLACIQCHSVNGTGGSGGPDLGRVIDRDFTPATLAATMWNHAPAMWAAMRTRNVRAGELSEQGAADLFAFFYSARFFEKPGDAGRGKRLFASKHCSDCHGLTDSKNPAAKPVAQWTSLGQPIALADALWNHAATMRREFERRKLGWPELTAQDLSDLLVYLRNLPATRGAPVRIEISAGTNGQRLFESRGCAGCHAADLAFTSRLKGETLTGIAVAMWNHAPKMAAGAGSLTVDEMRELAGYLWAGQFFEDSGNAAAGKRVFTAKHCSGCHGDAASGAPPLPAAGRPFSGAAMVSALWHHGPAMEQQMKTKGIEWPRFNGTEMADLVAFLNSAGEAKP